MDVPFIYPLAVEEHLSFSSFFFLLFINEAIMW